MKQDDLYGFSLAELNDLLINKGFKECHSREIYKLMYSKRMEDFSLAENLPKSLRTYMKHRFYVSPLKLIESQNSDDGTRKFLFQLIDGKSIECVYIPEPQRRTLCVSSQVGCKFHCAFCVSGKDGFGRNLTAAEMVAQVLLVNDIKAPETITNIPITNGPITNGPITNIVFMGTGEPLDNYEHLMRAITILREPQGLYIARRKVSISTCGIVPGIQRMIQDKQGVRLSISLHSTDNETRSRLMPINNTYPLEVLKESVQQFTQSERLPVLFEYMMIRGFNVSPADANSLVNFVKGIDCKINLIPYNPSPFYDWQPPTDKEIETFRNVLEEAGVFYWIRKSRGQDISAACGLLPHKR
jgi:23S rRNA (adenine2503-C2)-methyltransferase